MEYRIGEFSKIVRISIKGLRFYHQQGLLHPSSIDRDSGYRYYSDECIPKAYLILRLRDLEFSIKEIAEIIQVCNDDSDLVAYFEKKQDIITEKAERLKRIQISLNQFIKHEKEYNMIDKKQDITIKTVEAVKMISIRYKGCYGECGKYIGILMRTAGGKIAGKIFNRYHDEGYKENDADIEVCVPIRVKIEKEGITYTELPETKVISTMHLGPYDKVGDAYKRLIDYTKDHSVTLTGPCREIYIKGPGMFFRGNPNKYLTEIQFPIQ